MPPCLRHPKPHLVAAGLAAEVAAASAPIPRARNVPPSDRQESPLGLNLTHWGANCAPRQRSSRSSGRLWRTSSGWSTKVHLCLAAVDEARFSLEGGCAPERRKARESTQPHKNQTTHQREALQAKLPLMVAIASSRCPRASRSSLKRNLASLGLNKFTSSTCLQEARQEA